MAIIVSKENKFQDVEWIEEDNIDVDGIEIPEELEESSVSVIFKNDHSYHAWES